MKYNPAGIEPKWQKKWDEKGVFLAQNKSKKKKSYLLVEFPYPSGDGLHVGHARPYIGLDVVARKRRMEGYNALFPMGWDAFGLPTENYAIKTGVHPRKATEKNTRNFKRQQRMLGLSFDWSREINTTDPDYYKWTQWIFIQMFKKGLGFKAKIPVNWCGSCKIVLANEEVVEGKCERCGEKVLKKEKEQWLLRITRYSERLLSGLDKVDYPERVKISQREWIGKSEGVEVSFPVKGGDISINVFTTRPDTIFGATFVVLAPENPLIEKLKPALKNLKSVEAYIEESGKKLDKERMSRGKEKTGVMLKGVLAENPATGKEIPVFAADYVMMSYGTGTIMAVPAHDQKDLDFANFHDLPVIEAIKDGQTKNNPPRTSSLVVSGGKFESAYEGGGVLINSGRFDGMDSEIAKKRIKDWLLKKGAAKEATHYKLRDWIFSRQRYWGEPIPMIFCQNCARLPGGQGWTPVPESDLPVLLPEVKKYQPTEEGDSPLAAVSEWVNVNCPKCKKKAKRETDVMPNWAGSNWYYIRYLDPKNSGKPAAPALIKYWLPVDWYNGGMEHTNLHLLYSRFIFKFLWDIGVVPKEVGEEPYKKRTSHGVVLGEGGSKMSKSKGNVINPDKVVKKYGADTMRIYEMFMGPFEQMIPWDEKGVKGARRFLEKVWTLSQKARGVKESPLSVKKALHKTIKKISEDIDALKFNTAVSSLMEFSNAWQSGGGRIGRKDFQDFLKVFSAFAPHIAEEISEKAGFTGLLAEAKWPVYNKSLVQDKKFILIVQVNGKVRGKIEVYSRISEKRAKESALKQENIKKWLAGKTIKKIVFVPEKLINFVI